MNVQIIYLFSSLVLTAILGKFIIPILKRLKVGQNEREDGPRSHLRKQGTPTMGGIIMIISIIILIVATCLISNDIENINLIIVIVISSIGCGLIGFIDDFKKVVLKNTKGLNPRLKMLGLLTISTLYTVFLVNYTDLGTGIIIPFINYELILPVYIYIPFTIFVILSTTNAINLTDGVDGLAASVSAIIIIAISIIAMMLENIAVSIFGSIVTGACIGFLIYNFHKAKVIMGDTGSLLLGGVISSMAIYLKVQLVIVVIAIIPILETLSVMLQVMYFRKTGKRLFKMAPLHHHFELIGWRENRVVVVFSLVTLFVSIIGVMSIGV